MFATQPHESNKRGAQVTVMYISGFRTCKVDGPRCVGAHINCVRRPHESNKRSAQETDLAGFRACRVNAFRGDEGRNKCLVEPLSCSVTQSSKRGRGAAGYASYKASSCTSTSGDDHTSPTSAVLNVLRGELHGCDEGGTL